MLTDVINRIGVLRAVLAVGTIILILLAPFSLGETQFSGWGMAATLIAPATAPMLLFVYPLDMTMSAVFMSGADEAARRRHKFIILMDLVLLIALIAAWIPYFVQLVSS